MYCSKWGAPPQPPIKGQRSSLPPLGSYTDLPPLSKDQHSSQVIGKKGKNIPNITPPPSIVVRRSAPLVPAVLRVVALLCLLFVVASFCTSCPAVLLYCVVLGGGEKPTPNPFGGFRGMVLLVPAVLRIVVPRTAPLGSHNAPLAPHAALLFIVKCASATTRSRYWLVWGQVPTSLQSSFGGGLNCPMRGQEFLFVLTPFVCFSLLFCVFLWS
jgi:hypothetical protein